MHYDDDPVLAEVLDLKPGETERFDVFVMEKCDGSLKEHKRLIPKIGIDNLIQQLLEIAQTLQTEKICHNDVKPSNILYMEKKDIGTGKVLIDLKLSDFGMSDRWGGTAGWSPHNFTDDRKPGDDIYSFGLIILYLICEDTALFYIIRDAYLVDYSKFGYLKPPINDFRNLPEIKIILQMIDVQTTPTVQNIKAFDQILQKVGNDRLSDYHFSSIK